jgi:predicted amino acid racemase
MFLDFLRARNPALIDYGFYLLEKGLIEPDTYVLDLDRIGENAVRLGTLAKALKLRCYFMAKQLGHNPLVSRKVLEADGFDGMVAVDFREAEILHAAGLPVRHLGHLVQVPSHAWDRALDMKPEVITLYSYEKALELSTAASRRCLRQDVLLRVQAEEDVIYSGQEGGLRLDELAAAVEKMAILEGLRIAGLTSFPCFLFDQKERKALATANMATLQKGAALLKSLGLNCEQINMPSCNSLGSLPLAASRGATHVEPGHSLTGTSPDNMFYHDPLVPSFCYITEVSHQWGGYASCFGGGYYRRGKLQKALVKTGQDLEEVPVQCPDPEAIDYHLRIQGDFPSGAPVCMAFRTQIFITRSQVAVAEGLSGSRPRLAGIWDAQGLKVSGGEAE